MPANSSPKQGGPHTIETISTERDESAQRVHRHEAARARHDKILDMYYTYAGEPGRSVTRQSLSSAAASDYEMRGLVNDRYTRRPVGGHFGQDCTLSRLSRMRCIIKKSQTVLTVRHVLRCSRVSMLDQSHGTTGRRVDRRGYRIASLLRRRRKARAHRILRRNSLTGTTAVELLRFALSVAVV